MGNVTSYGYDDQGRLHTVLAPAINGVRAETTYAYDADGSVASVTDANGQTVRFTYDAFGNRALEQDAAGNTLTRTYSATNQILTETVYLIPDPDGAGPAEPAEPFTAAGGPPGLRDCLRLGQ
jgi:YD repeat-containing protein